MSAPDERIRRCTPGDRPALVRICHETGYMGLPAAPYFRDADLFGRIFAVAYLDLEPDFCFVAEEGGAVLGYCVGTPDTARFAAAFAARQLPAIRRRILAHTFWRTPGDVLRVLRWAGEARAHRDEAQPWLASYPAHLHIDLLPAARRRGLGRALMDRFLAALRAAGAPGLHLGTSTRNEAALAFYAALGFTPIGEGPETLWRVPGVRAIRLARAL